MSHINTRNRLPYPLILFALIFSFSSFAQDNPPELPKVDESFQGAAKDDPASRNYVLSTERLVNKFERAYQSARNANMDTKQNYLVKMNSVYEEFTKLKYNSSDNAMVMDLKKLVGTWMDKRMNYIDKLIMELVYKNDYSQLMHTAEIDYIEHIYLTNASRPVLDEGNGIYSTMMAQMSKVKSYYSI